MATTKSELVMRSILAANSRTGLQEWRKPRAFSRGIMRIKKLAAPAAPARAPGVWRGSGFRLQRRQPVEQRDPERLRQLRPDRHAEMAVGGEAAALHRVLLGHEDRQVAAEGQVA